MRSKFGSNIIHLFRFLRPVIPLPKLINLTGQRLILPMYHTVTDFPPLHVKHLYPVKNKKEFINDLGFFLKYYKPISAAELIKINRQDKAFGNYFHLSFDDGFS